jgi:hypothetical protein
MLFSSKKALLLNFYFDPWCSISFQFEGSEEEAMTAKARKQQIGLSSSASDPEIYSRKYLM